jgi:hypothetical protein
MSEAFERARAELAKLPTPTVEDFINHGKNNFVELSLMFGEGFVVHAVNIAELLLKAQQTCSNCGMYYCECGEYE